MDKRTLIAVVFTILVLLGWQNFIVAPKQREMARRRAVADSIMASREDSLAAAQPEAAPEAAQEVASPEATEAEGGAAGEAEAFLEKESDGAPDIEIAVVTESMRIVLGSRGGEVRSAALLDFYTEDGGPVELVPEGSAGGFAVSLTVDGARRLLSDRNFAVQIDGRSVAGDEEIFLGGQRENVEVLFVVEEQDGGRIQKRFTFNREGYEIGLHVNVKREGALKETSAYAISWECGMAVTEKNEKGDTRQFASLGRVGEEYYKESMSKFGKTNEKMHDGMIVWAGTRSKYFLSAALPEEQRSGRLLMLGDRAAGYIGYGIEYPFRGDPHLIEDHYRCYLGPLDMKSVKAYGVGLEKTIDLGRLRFLSVAVLNLMLFLERFIPNYGLIIIILSVLTKIIFYRLTHKSFKSMKDMQRIQPRIKELQEKFKDDREKINKETMKLYKEAGVNPLGGCLPLLLQMPVFIALFNVLRNTIELRGAPFVLWINDLSSPDVLFSFGAKLPFLGSDFHLLPILMGAAMVLQSKVSGSPTGEGAPAAQTKMMTTMMPIVFTVLFYGMPSGLVLYWFVNNIFTIVQQYFIHREVEAEQVDGSPAETLAMNKGKESRGEDAGRRNKPGKGGGNKSRKGTRNTYH